MIGSIPHQKFCFIIYLLEDEQELSLGMLIRLQRIYNFLLFHAIILSILDVFIYIYSNYILYFGTDLLTQCLVLVAVFFLFLVLQKIHTKQSPNATKLVDDFFLDKRDPRSFEGSPDDKWGDDRTTGHALMSCGSPVAPLDLIPLLLRCVCWDPMNCGFMIRLFMRNIWVFSELIYAWLL